MVEIGAVLARRGSNLETINPELNFYRLVFVFFLGHAIGRNAVVNVAESGL
jgi:hypothetical protein